MREFNLGVALGNADANRVADLYVTQTNFGASLFVATNSVIERSVFSGNPGYGVFVGTASTGNRIAGNLIDGQRP